MNEEIARIYQSNYFDDFNYMDKDKKLDFCIPRSYLKGYLLNNNFVTLLLLFFFNKKNRLFKSFSQTSIRFSVKL